jgi:diguanylate cyclase (GGDEF)-like protein
VLVKPLNKQDLDLTWPIQAKQTPEARAQTEHLRLIFSHSTYVILGNLAAAISLLVGSWRLIDQLTLLAWFAGIIGFSLVRWLIGWRFPDGALSEAEVARWDRRFLISVTLSGLLWGAAGGLFFIPGNPGHNFFLALLVIGLAAAAATSLSYHRFAYPFFFLPAILPISVLLAFEDGHAEQAMGLVLPFYFLLLYRLSRNSYQSVHTAILSRIEHRHLAYYDHLTNIANRRAFEEVMKKEWLRALRSGSCLSLIITDIDDFKRYNDTYGHAIGDQVLQSVAKSIQSRIRRGADLVARIGGEEFAIIIPETDPAGARALGEQIRRQCHHFAAKSGRRYPAPTLSVGVSACVPNDKLSPETLFEQADQALYQAKERGKNRVVAALPDSD